MYERMTPAVLLIMRIHLRPRPFQQAGHFSLRTTRPVFLASLIQLQNLQRQSVPNRSGSDSPTPVTKDREAMQIATKKDLEEALNTIKELQLSLEPIIAKFPKEYRGIDDSLDPFAIRPDAPWGFVVFRTVYGAHSDAPWTRMLEHLRLNVTKTMSPSNRDDLIPRHQLTVIEDEKTLAGADSHTVRQAFRAWVADDLTPRFQDPERYGGSAQVHSKLLSNDAHDEKHPVSCLPPRWNFCLLVDEACLRSLDSSTFPAIKILTTDWREDRVTAVAEGWEDGETDNEWEEVGWMYMDVADYVDMYHRLGNAFYWLDYYERPYEGYV